jgi:transmembrane sensor
MSATLLVWPARVGIAMDKQLAQKLSPLLPAERIERQWRAIEARTAGGRFGFGWLRARPFQLAFAVAAAAALLLALRLGQSASAPVAGGAFKNAGAGPAALKLLDGSQVLVSPSGRVEFRALSTSAVELVLTQGSVELDVTHVEGRRFVVRAGDVDVIVRGTHFRVELADADPKVVSVSVQRGQVEVRQPRLPGAAIRLLGAGMSWTMGQRDAAPSPATTPAIPETTPPVANPGKADGDGTELGATHSTEVTGPKQLLEQADAARQSGDARKAASALDQLRRHYRSDPRAGLAALQLGRLRLDSLHDAAGALEAFRDAMTLSASPSVQEDALARQAQALEALGNSAGCERVRDQYLSRYPSGIHSASIARRCGGK